MLVTPGSPATQGFGYGLDGPLDFQAEGIQICQLRPEDTPKPLDIGETSVRIGLRTPAPITETGDLALFNLTIDSKLRG
jgi:hypothetical protein